RRTSRFARLRDMTEPPRFLSLEADEVASVTASDGAVLPLYSLAGPGDAPWLRMLSTTMRVFAYDARGHGGATWPAGPLEAVFHVDRFADELAAVATT